MKLYKKLSVTGQNHVILFFCFLCRVINPVPVQSVRLSSQAQDRALAVVYTDGEPVIYAEAVPRHMFCDVTGGYPEPIVRMYVDDTDITSLFSSSVRMVRDPGSRELHYNVRLTNDDFIIE
jgi:hypothetical protein